MLLIFLERGLGSSKDIVAPVVVRAFGCPIAASVRSQFTAFPLLKMVHVAAVFAIIRKLQVVRRSQNAR